MQLLALEGEGAAAQHAVGAAVDDAAVGQVGQAGRHSARVGVKVARTVGEMHEACDAQAVLVVVLHHATRQGHEASLHGAQFGLEVTPRAAHEALAAQEPATDVVMRVAVEERPAVRLVFLDARDAKAPLGVGRVAHKADLHAVAGDLHRGAREVGTGVAPHHGAAGTVDLDKVVTALKVGLLVKRDGQARGARIAVHPGVACTVGIGMRARKVSGLRHHMLVADDLDLHRLRHAAAVHRSARHRGRALRHAGDVAALVHLGYRRVGGGPHDVLVVGVVGKHGCEQRLDVARLHGDARLVEVDARHRLHHVDRAGGTHLAGGEGHRRRAQAGRDDRAILPNRHDRGVARGPRDVIGAVGRLNRAHELCSLHAVEQEQRVVVERDPRRVEAILHEGETVPARIIGSDGLRVAQNLEARDVLVHRLLHDLVFAVLILLCDVDLFGKHEGIFGDARHRGGDVHARKRGAPLEGSGADGSHAVGYHDLGEGGVALERLVGNASQNDAVQLVGKRKLGGSALVARDNGLLASIEDVGVGVLPHLGLFGRGVGGGRGRGCIGVGR